MEWCHLKNMGDGEGLKNVVKEFIDLFILNRRTTYSRLWLNGGSTVRLTSSPPLGLAPLYTTTVNIVNTGQYRLYPFFPNPEDYVSLGGFSQ